MFNNFKFFELPVQKEENVIENHLKEGIKPIMASVLTHDQLAEGFEKDAIDRISKSGLFVNYYAAPNEMNKKSILNNNHNSYGISPVEGSDKYSNIFMNCTGIAVVGIDNATGKNISFLTHQDPRYFLYTKDKFLHDLNLRLNELKSRSQEKTIDAVIFGGNYFKIFRGKPYMKDYRDSINMLSSEIKSVFGFEPIIINGPKTMSGGDDVYLDNNNRRLIIVRPQVGKPSTNSYFPRNLKTREKLWEKPPKSLELN